ncbi:MAG TPA: hypothetical protein VNQ56_17860 [Pseudolabrys sp.]|nr:hypothetical protein [Pseudolabrys sp.]
MHNRYVLFLSAAAMIVASAADAHNPRARHGGRIAHAGSYHVELVTEGKTVNAFLVGHDDRAMSADGYKGTAILLVDGKRQRIPLAPRDNRLTGDADTNLPEGVTGVVQITNPTGATSSAKFN